MANHKVTQKYKYERPKHKVIKARKLRKDAKVLQVLNQKQKLFCREYIWDWNATRAYKVVYKGVKSDAVAAAAATRLLNNVKINAYIEEIQKDLSKLCGISKEMIITELKKMAFTSIAHLHNKWIELKDFEALTTEQKDSIQEIDTKVIKKNIGTAIKPELVDVEYVRIKLFDKTKSIEIINKMLGNNAADELKVSGGITLTWHEEKTYVQK